MSAIIYIRVSTDEQAQYGYSLASQQEACQRYASLNQLIVTKVLQDEMSGAKLDRPGLNELRQLVATGTVTAVVIFSPDRLTRSLAHSLILREEMQAKGVAIHYVNKGKIEETAESAMQENIEAVFAEYWRTKIIESSKRGRLAKAASGRWPCDGHAPYGYRKEGKGRQAHLVIDSAEAAIVQRIVNEIEEGKGYGRLAAELTEEEIPPPNRGYGCKSPSKIWHRQRIKAIITRQTYIGKLKYGEYDIEAPELIIISPEQFERVQLLIDSHINPRKNDYLLVGHLTCVCGRSMHGFPMRREYVYYVCSSYQRRQKYSCGVSYYLRADIIDRLVWEWVLSLLTPEIIGQGIVELVIQNQDDLQEYHRHVNLIRSALAKSEAKMSALLTAMKQLENATAVAALGKEMERIGEEIEALTGELNRTLNDIAQSTIDPKEYQEMLTAVTTRLDNVTFETKRQVMKLIDCQVELIQRTKGKGVICWCNLTSCKKEIQI